MRRNWALILLAGVVVVVTIALGYRWLNPPQRTFDALYPGDPAAVTRLLMRNGTTGEAVETEEPATIAVFFDLTRSATYTRDWDLRPRAGWRYYVDLFTGASEARVLRVTFLGTAVEIDGARYNLDRDLSDALDALYYRDIQSTPGAEAPDKTAARLFQAYLDGYRREDQPQAMRLEDATINTIEIVETREDGFVFAVSFDVKPVAANSDWVVGNGVAHLDGWIVSKYLYVTVEAVDGVPTITGKGTGP